LFESDGFGIDGGGDLLDRFDVGKNDELRCQNGQHLLGYRRGRHPADRFASGGAPSPFVIPDAIFGLIGVIGMRRPEHGGHLGVSFRSRILVAHHDADRSAGGLTVEYSGENLAPILFLARGDDLTLAGAPPIEGELNFRDVEGNTGRTTVDDDTDAATM